jgi:L-rhamnose mutarotase
MVQLIIINFWNQGGWNMVRHGQLIGLKPEKLDEYKKYHANIWPEVSAQIKACNIQNYSIFHKDGQLFAYFEYVGDDFEADMAKMAAHPKTQEWWDVMMPMQVPVENRNEGEWWAELEEVFHLD